MSGSEYMDICEQLSRDLWQARKEVDRLQKLLTMCAELVREEANTHDDDCDCDYCEAVAALEQKP